jgi:hypothetical protein
VFLELIAENALIQHVNFPTGGDNYLDLLFTTDTLIYANIFQAQGLIQSDHRAIEGMLNLPAPVLKYIPPTRVVRVWKRIDLNEFKKALGNCPWSLMDSTENIQKCCELFYDLLNAVIADNVPAARTFVSRIPHWYSEETISAYKDKRRAHRRWKRSQQQSDYIEFSENRRLFKYKVDID